MFEAHFIEGSAGRLFVTVRRPESGPSIPAVLVCPAFGDEMNKTRRMLAVLGDRLAASNMALVNPDLYGTGDSEGQFEDAAWEQWLDDLVTVAGWLNSRNMSLIGLLGIRTGALLASQMSNLTDGVCASVFWQGVDRGAAFVNQMLRVRIVSRSVHEGIRESSDALREVIDRDGSLSVAGYILPKLVIGPLDSLVLSDIATAKLGRLRCIDVSRAETDVRSEPLLLGSATGEALKIAGEPYWSSVETICDERVLTLTVDHFLGTARNVG